MPITLPDLPFDLDALEPHMSARTLQFHHGKHHKGYVDKTNNLIKGTDLHDKDLERIVREAAKDQQKATLFNNAAQVWNHSFFWQCLTAESGVPEGELASELNGAFGGLDGFKRAFAEAATGRFGSGWTWLVLDQDRLEIVSTANAETPLTAGRPPLLTCDVWEHAYYLDYQNDRGTFVRTFLDHLVNWEFVAARLEEARSEAKQDAA